VQKHTPKWWTKCSNFRFISSETRLCTSNSMICRFLIFTVLFIITNGRL